MALPWLLNERPLEPADGVLAIFTLRRRISVPTNQGIEAFNGQPASPLVLVPSAPSNGEFAVLDETQVEFGAAPSITPFFNFVTADWTNVYDLLFREPLVAGIGSGVWLLPWPAVSFDKIQFIYGKPGVMAVPIEESAGPPSSGQVMVGDDLVTLTQHAANVPRPGDPDPVATFFAVRNSTAPVC